LLTLSGYVNLALTLFAASMVTTQLPVPEQAPVQPVKVDSADGVAVRVTKVASLKLAMHVAPQSIPAGLLVTLSKSVPDLLTVSV
jgi:hypothetical protein